jgi:hypothetical protein
MFPSNQDIAEFSSEFGQESFIGRSYVTKLACFGTQVAAVVMPEQSKEATLTRAWGMVRRLADWVLTHADELPPKERIFVIVGWSRSVRTLQGQIFKAGGDIETIRAIAASEDWSHFEQKTQYRALLPRWEKDVFDEHAV